MNVSLFAMFPGQGSQYVGMGRELLAEFPYTKLVFEEAEDATGASIRKLCLDGPEDQLKLTAFTQPCLLTTSTATWRVLQQETGLRPSLFAGHSLGEYSAAVAAGWITFSRAAFLVRRRGEAMQEAVPEGIGGMAAILNCPADELQALCAQVSKTQSLVEVVNFNTASQLVVAGHQSAIERLLPELEKIERVKSIPLAVSAPFHSSLMGPAREKMTPLLNDTPIAATGGLMIPNVTGKLEPKYALDFLIQQIDSAVRWTDTVATAVDLAANVFLEIGPGKVLCGLARRAVPKETKVIATDSVKASLAEILQITQS